MDILQWSGIQAVLLLSENWTLYGSLFHLFAECIFGIFTVADFLTVQYVGRLSRVELIKQMKRESQHRVQHKVHFIKFLGAGGVTECVDRPDWDTFAQVDAGSAWEVKTEKTEWKISPNKNVKVIRSKLWSEKQKKLPLQNSKIKKSQGANTHHSNRVCLLWRQKTKQRLVV